MRAPLVAVVTVLVLAAGVTTTAAAAAEQPTVVHGIVTSETFGGALGGMRIELVHRDTDGTFGPALVTTFSAGAGDPEPLGTYELTVPASATPPLYVRAVDPDGTYLTSYDYWGRNYPARWYLTDTFVPSGQWDFAMAQAGRYLPIDPVRVLDTRWEGVPVRGGDWFDFDLPETDGVVAVVVNITTTGTQCATTYIADHTDVIGQDHGGSWTSIVNARGGADVANLTVLRVLRGGVVTPLYNHSCPTHVVVDLQGYYVADTLAAGYRAVAPERVLDTRLGVGALGPGESLVVDVESLATDVPPDAVAVAVNLTATGSTARTSYLSAYAAGDPQGPWTSVLNAYRGQDVANLAIVPLAQDGSIEIYNDQGSTHVVLDVQGWFVANGGVSFWPLHARRTEGSAAPIGPGQVRQVATLGNGIEVPADAEALWVNLTSTATTVPTTFVTAYPAGSDRPATSNLNPRGGADLANSAIVRLGDGGHTLFNNRGSVTLLEDVNGWFGAGPLD